MKTSTPFLLGRRTQLIAAAALTLTSGLARSASVVQYETSPFMPNADASPYFAQFDNESPGSVTVNLTNCTDMFATSVIDLTKTGSSAQIASLDPDYGLEINNSNYSVTSVPELHEWVLGPVGLALLVLMRRQR